MMAVAKTKKVNPRNMTAVDQVIATRIRARRLEIDVTQEVLGQQLGVTFQQIQKYERGVNRIACSRLLEIAHVLKIDITYFLEGLKVNGKGAAAKSRFADFMATTDGVEINGAMLKLSDAHRRSVINLARSLVGTDGE